MPILDEQTLDFISHGAEQTRRFGARMGALLQAGDVICLEGDLGSGKTCFAQGVGQGMGITEPVTSPSFTLISEYRPPPPLPILYHVDLYRLDAPVEEALGFGLEDYLRYDGVCLVEWADRIRAILPQRRLWITLRHLAPGKRGILMQAAGSRYDGLLRQFRERAFGV
jgi:tRNA threonylcarbamoyladenosine biosynthesis protein TsaE